MELQTMQIRYGWSPEFACIEHGAPDEQIVNPSSGGDGDLEGGEDRQDLITFAPCHTASGDESESTTPTSG